MKDVAKDISRIADALELIAAALPTTEVKDDRASNQWADKTQVLNMTVGAGFAGNWDGVERLMTRKRNPLPKPQPEGWWMPNLLGWLADEKERRQKRTARAARRARRKGTKDAA